MSVRWEQLTCTTTLSVSLSINPLSTSIGPAATQSCWVPQCWYHPWGFLTTNLPVRFNKESADDAILTVNLLYDMQTPVGKDSSSTPQWTTAATRTRWEMVIVIQLRIWEEVWNCFMAQWQSVCRDSTPLQSQTSLVCWNKADQAGTVTSVWQLQFSDSSKMFQKVSQLLLLKGSRKESFV